MNHRKLTVITVALNAADDLPLTIESVINQSYKNIEYIFVDGLSCDRTHAIIARYKDAFSRIEVLEDAGIYQAMNEAAHFARGEYVLFLNAGDQLHNRDSVANIFSRIDGDPDIVYGDHVFIEKRKEFLKRSADFSWINAELRAGRLNHVWHSRIPGHQATFTRTTLLRAMPYDTRYSICADHDLLMRAYDAGAKFQYIDEIVAQYMAGGYSGMQGDKVLREWALSYRSHSLRPSFVDAFLFGGHGKSPYSSHNSFSGYIMSGAYADEGPFSDGFLDTPARWVGLLEMRSPDAGYSTGLRITGRNDHDHQALSFMVGNHKLARVPLPTGQFDLNVAFSELLPEGTTFTIAPDILKPLGHGDERIAGYVLGDYHFQLIEPLPVTYLDASDTINDHMVRALGRGWSGIEVVNGFVWSIEQEAAVYLPISPAPNQLTFSCNGNPFVEGGQLVEVLVNDALAGSFTAFAGAEPRTFDVPVAGLWRSAVNIVKLRVDKRARPPADPRKLGIALSRLAWS